jgi:hypothetical protein
MPENKLEYYVIGKGIKFISAHIYRITFLSPENKLSIRGFRSNFWQIFMIWQKADTAILFWVTEKSIGQQAAAQIVIAKQVVSGQRAIIPKIWSPSIAKIIFYPHSVCKRPVF